MISGLRVKNFKAFGNEGATLRIRPITLLFGPNSSGKSSLLHSLALIHASTVDDNFDVTYPLLTGKNVDLGGFRQYVHQRKTSNEVTLGVTALMKKKPSKRLKRTLPDVSEISYNSTIRMQRDEEGRQIVRVASIDIAYQRNDSNETEPLLRLEVDLDAEDDSYTIVKINKDHPIIQNIFGLIRDKGEVSVESNEVDKLLSAINSVKHFRPLGLYTKGLLIRPVNKSKFTSEEKALEAFESDLARQFTELIGDVISATSFLVERAIKATRYLAHTRYYPPRHEQEYFFSFEALGIGIEAYQMLKHDDEVRALINVWLGEDKLKTDYQFSVSEFFPMNFSQFQGERIDPEKAVKAIEKMREEGGERKELILTDRRTDTRVTLRDIGFGISQVIPVLVTALATSQKLFVVEEPESQLHPALATALGDVYIHGAMGKPGNRFILETHSEHMMLRLLRRVRQTTEDTLPEGFPPVTPNDIAVYYVEPTAGGSKLTEIPITEDGEFGKAWPKGFFDERLQELTE